MRFGEWLDTLPQDAMISGIDDKLTRAADGSLHCTAYWWSPAEMRADMREDLAEEGVPCLLYLPDGPPRRVWAVKIRTGEFHLSWATLAVPG
jgi:hypothetical protein